MQARTHTNKGFTPSLLAVLIAVVMFVVGGAEKLAAESKSDHNMDSRSPAKIVDIVRDPTDIPMPIGSRPPRVVNVTLKAMEVVGQLDPASGTTYRYWTFNGKVPAPFIRVREGDKVVVTLQNDKSSHMAHSVDFHAALGPGGGAAFSQAVPGESKTFSFKATTPGLYVYHCGTPMIAEHIANGMYGMILVEPAGGLQHVDHEYYVMQGEMYTDAPKGKSGMQQFSAAKMIEEHPEYFVFNGAVDALTKTHPMQAEVGQTIRIFFGDAGPNKPSSLHGVGEIFTRDYALGALTSPPLTGVQTASVPPGGAAMLELKTTAPGQFAFMDHAMARMAKGLMAVMNVTGKESADLMHAGPDHSAQEKVVSGITEADAEAATSDPASLPSASVGISEAHDAPMAGMDMPMNHSSAKKASLKGAKEGGAKAVLSLVPPSSKSLDGCLSLLDDGRAVIKLMNSAMVYRVEGRPTLFSQNASRMVHLTGYYGSVVATEDPNLPSFVVDTVDMVASNCAAKVTSAQLRKVSAKVAAEKEQAARELAERETAAESEASESGNSEATHSAVTVGMGDMTFDQPKIVVKIGQTVVWKNSSNVVHDVVDDEHKAITRSDVQVPPKAKSFASGYLQPGQTYAHTFTIPGVYRYVCSLHETSGMKGEIVVK